MKGGRSKKGSNPAGSDVAFKKITVRYTGQKLHEKGVILEVEGLPQHQSVIERTNQINIFKVLSLQIQKCHV